MPEKTVPAHIYILAQRGGDLGQGVSIQQHEGQTQCCSRQSTFNFSKLQKTPIARILEKEVSAVPICGAVSGPAMPVPSAEDVLSRCLLIYPISHRCFFPKSELPWPSLLGLQLPRCELQAS